jgi:hypothetical protein
MPVDAILTLRQLACIAESDGNGHSEPYIWPVLLRIDDGTLTTPQLLSVIAPVVGHARDEIAQDMRAGQTAAIPAGVGVLRTRYADGQSTRKAVVVVALWESDETPDAAVRAGYQAFVSEVGAAIADNLVALKSARDTHDDAELDRLIGVIKARVESRVRAAIRNALTATQKLKVKLGILNLDDFVGSEFKFFDTIADAGVDLTIADVGDRYRLTGELDARIVVPDRCQAFVDRVRDAQATVNGINAEIAELQAELHGGSDLPKAAIIAEIKRIRAEDLPPARSELLAAQAALAACRAGQPHVDPVPVAVG